MTTALARRLWEAGIRDERVLHAVAQVQRRLFLPPALRDRADDDAPLPIGHGQTISQPYVVAAMTEALALEGTERVLEVGTGSGYQTALLALLSREVFSVEIVPELSARAATLLLGDMGLENVHLRVSDGWYGWPEEAPYDRILLTAAPVDVPPPLLEQLREGGKLVAPLGEAEGVQALTAVDKGPGGVLSARQLLQVRFVPLRRGEPRLA
ncbi:MAG TPA: protein-L-isoaspartate(D-aspartate) O-methyltransferase [Anaeromyxobacteraceae bacterium]|nr:protein-L-isoaspartate(D-aspartate) O-methyltransferase [Anaeromyxobacteraceae bacterium]